MNCWAILELSPGADRSDVKQAYARKLKQTRPDVDPEGFKQLHAAYKLALNSAAPRPNSHGPESLPDPVEAPEHGQSASWPPERDTPAMAVSAERQPADSSAGPGGETADGSGPPPDPLPAETLAQLERQLAGHIDGALRDRRTAADVESWTFLQAYEELQDIQLRAELSLHLFGRLLKNPKLVDSKGKAFAYLDDFFGWTHAADVLVGAYGAAASDLLEPLEMRRSPGRSRWICPKAHPGPLEWGGYYTRIGATLLDLLIFVALLAAYSFVSAAFAGSEPDYTAAFLLTVPAYLVCAAVLEASPLQGTPGKVLMGLKVTTARGRRANIFLTLWRTLVFTASTAAFKITVWINFFVNDGRLLHDHLSGTVVIKRF